MLVAQSSESHARRCFPDTPAALKQLPWLDGLAQLPGLHMALGLASAVASYVNLYLLWHWLKKSGVYQRQPGWSRHIRDAKLSRPPPRG